VSASAAETRTLLRRTAHAAWDVSGLARALRTIERGICNAVQRLKSRPGCADSPLGVICLRLPRAMRPRVRGEAGYTMIELIVVMAIMGIVLAALTTSFAAGVSAESGTIRRAEAEGNARTAVNRMRMDIHCASAAPAPQENPYGGFTLTLTESPSTCPFVTSTSSGVQWCTIPVSGSTTQWQLFRFLGTLLTDCNGSANSTLLVDYITQPSAGWPTNSDSSPTPPDWAGNLWPSAPTCTTGSLPAVSVQLTVNVDPVGHPFERYELQDSIALRNALRCT
jgi:prepilin-type N-terminal cleavage/methylation domain-containing protein